MADESTHKTTTRLAIGGRSPRNVSTYGVLLAASLAATVAGCADDEPKTKADEAGWTLTTPTPFDGGEACVGDSVLTEVRMSEAIYETYSSEEHPIPQDSWDWTPKASLSGPSVEYVDIPHTGYAWFKCLAPGVVSVELAFEGQRAVTEVECLECDGTSSGTDTGSSTGTTTGTTSDPTAGDTGGSDAGDSDTGDDNPGIPVGLIDGIEKVDAFQIMLDAVWGGQVYPAMILAAYFDGAVGIDPYKGDVVFDEFVLEYSEDLGVIAMSGGDGKVQGDAFVEFSAGGLRLVPYDSANDTWGSSQWIGNGACLDATPLGNDPESGTVVYTTPFGEVGFVNNEPGTDTWTVGEVVSYAQFPMLFDGIISAFARTSPGAFLVIEGGTPGELYLYDGSTGVSIATLGDSPRKIRCLDEVCGITNFGSNTVTVVHWDVADNVTVVGTHDVGDGPVGLDLRRLDNDDIAMVSTGFNDATVQVTIVSPTGRLVSEDSWPATDGCTQPAHANWILDGSDNVAVSCYGSDNLAIMDSGL